MKNKIIDIICFVGGTFLFIITLFNYHTYGRNGDGNIYYSNFQIILLAVGVSLVVFGFLIRKWRKEK